MSKSIIVSAIQIENRIGDRHRNLCSAENLIEKAAQEGAVLLALPELSACGYLANDNIWDYGEPADGSTAQWVTALSKRLGIYIGIGFLECDGTDFFNSYLISNPKGSIDGIIRKNHAESYCFQSGGDNADIYIQTDIGRIGVGICADSHLLEFFNRIKQSNIDILLLPHGWATPYKTTKHISQKDINKAKQTMKDLGVLYVKCLGVPVVFINSVGDLQPMPGILGSQMSPAVFRLQGASQIVDSDGKVKQVLVDSEDYIVDEVMMKSKNKIISAPVSYNGWLHPGSWIVRNIIIPWDTRMGKKHYRNSNLRKQKARQIKSPF